ncbi:phosphatase PAP2 family protein [soil metagenome]
MTAQAERTTPTAPDTPARATRRPARIAALCVWSVVVAAWWWRFGIPNDSITVLLTLWLGTIAWNIEAPWRYHLAYVRDWSVPAVLLTFYFFSRGLVDEFDIDIHWTMPIDVDVWIGGGVTPTERLQHAWCGDPCLRTSDPRWYDAYFTTVYATHFLAGLSIAAVLWVRDRAEWLKWMRRFIWLNLGGLVIYIAYPMAPPWLASKEGYLGDVARLTSRGWRDIGLSRVDVILNGVGNPVAAMPSLHAGTAILIAIYGITRLRSPWRWLLALYAASMCVALVYNGEHYVIDEIAGGALAVLVLVLASRWERWRTPAPEPTPVASSADQ